MNRTTLSLAIRRALVAPVGACVMIFGAPVLAQQVSAPAVTPPANYSVQTYPVAVQNGTGPAYVSQRPDAGAPVAGNPAAQPQRTYQYVQPAPYPNQAIVPGQPPGRTTTGGPYTQTVVQTPQGLVVYQTARLPVVQQAPVVYQAPNGQLIYSPPANAPPAYPTSSGPTTSYAAHAAQMPGVQQAPVVYQTPNGQLIYSPPASASPAYPTSSGPTTPYAAQTAQMPGVQQVAQNPVVYQAPGQVGYLAPNGQALYAPPASTSPAYPPASGATTGYAAQAGRLTTQAQSVPPRQVYQQPVMMYQQLPQQQYVYVESSQPGLYRRVPVQAPQQQAPVAVASAAANKGAKVSGPATHPVQRRALTAPKRSQVPEVVPSVVPVVNTKPSSMPSRRAVSLPKKSNLPILTNPLLTKRAAEQARDIAIEQTRKKEARQKAAQYASTALQTAGTFYQRAGASAQALGTAAVNQAASLAGQLPAAAGKVVSYQPVNSASLPQAPVQYAQGVPGQPAYPPQAVPVRPVYPTQMMYPNAQAVSPGQIFLQQPNGQWIAQAANPYIRGLPQAQVPVAIQPPPVTVYQNAVPVQYAGQPVYQHPGQNLPGTATFPGTALVPRQLITQLVPPRPLVSTMSSAVSPATTLAQVATNAVISNLVSSPEQRAVERKLSGSLTKSEKQTSTQPLISITRNDLKRANANNVEAALNTFPQVTPSDGATSNFAQGLANVNVRGLGVKRTAVLINGRPFVPADGNGLVNLDAIPVPLIERIDIVTGGNSAAYGSGAVAGTVNFVVNDRFKGTRFDVNHESALDGEGGATGAALTFGTDFANQKGNIALSVGATERSGVRQGDRDFSRFAQLEDVDSQGNPVLIDGGSSGVPGTSIFSAALGTFSPSFGATFDADGSMRPFNAQDVGSGSSDFYNFAEVNYLQLPQARRQGMAVGSFSLTDNHELYGTALVSSVETTTESAPGPVFVNADFTIDGSPFLLESTQQILSDAFGNGIDSDGDGTDDTGAAFLRRRMVELGGRRGEHKSQTRFVEGGLRGSFGQLEYDVYLSKGKVAEKVSRTGGFSRERFIQGLVLDLDSSLDGQACQDPSSNGSATPCVPVNIFGPGNISPEAANFLRFDARERATSTQSTYGANITGNFDVLPGGTARVTVGAERRDAAFRRELETSEPLTAQDLLLLNANSVVDGSTTIDSVYGEVYLPLLADFPGVRRLDAEAAYRLSDHSSAGRFASYKVAASWSPIDYVTVRASYDSSNRAPSIAELFLPQTESFFEAFDPCSAAAGSVSPEVAAQCIALGVPEELVGSFFLNLPSGQLRTLRGGNPDLSEESAETYSAGVSVNFPINENTEVSLGADYFTVEGDRAIGEVGVNGANFLQSCFDSSFATTGELNPFCSFINRRSDGSIESADLFNQNGASFVAEGFDFNAGISSRLGNGLVSLNYIGSQLESARFTAFEGAETQECAGQFGRACFEPRPSYKHRLAATYQDEKVSADLIWRHVGRVSDDNDTIDYAVENISSRNYIDLQFNLQLSDRTDVALGVQNIANTMPPVIGDNQGNANTYPQTFDPLGRTFFLRFTGTSGLGEK